MKVTLIVVLAVAALSPPIALMPRKDPAQSLSMAAMTGGHHARGGT
jgi:hypothetical protein